MCVLNERQMSSLDSLGCCSLGNRAVLQWSGSEAVRGFVSASPDYEVHCLSVPPLADCRGNVLSVSADKNKHRHMVICPWKYCSMLDGTNDVNIRQHFDTGCFED